MMNGVVILKAESRIGLINRKAESMLNYLLKEMPGKLFDSFLYDGSPENKGLTLVKYLKGETLGSGRYHRIILKGKRSNADTFFLQINPDQALISNKKYLILALRESARSAAESLKPAAIVSIKHKIAVFLQQMQQTSEIGKSAIPKNCMTTFGKI